MFFALQKSNLFTMRIFVELQSSIVLSIWIVDWRLDIYDEIESILAYEASYHTIQQILPLLLRVNCHGNKANENYGIIQPIHWWSDHPEWWIPSAIQRKTRLYSKELVVNQETRGRCWYMVYSYAILYLLTSLVSVDIFVMVYCINSDNVPCFGTTWKKLCFRPASISGHSTRYRFSSCRLPAP